MDFTMDHKDILKFMQLSKKAPRRLGYASANLLTSFAFGTRRKSIQVIAQKMTVRAQSFIVGSIRYDRAKGNKSINAQVSEVGSIRRPRFSGLVEQETGVRTKRSRVFTQLARRDKITNIVPGPHRLKGANVFPSRDDYGGSAIALINVLKRKKYKKPFIISGHKRFKKGLYKFVRNRLRKIQDFEPRRVQPKRVKWLTLGRIRYFKGADINKQWNKSIKRIFKI
jgi:hypothetical protein